MTISDSPLRLSERLTRYDCAVCSQSLSLDRARRFVEVRLRGRPEDVAPGGDQQGRRTVGEANPNFLDVWSDFAVDEPGR